MGKEKDGEAGDAKLGHVQIGLLEDLSGRCLQERFREFCADAMAALCVSNDDGMILEAEAHAAKMKVGIEIRRVSGKTVYSMSAKVETKLPGVPPVVHEFKAIRGVGLAQSFNDVQMTMFPREGA